MPDIKDIIELWSWEPFTKRSWVNKKLGLKISITKYQSINSGKYYLAVELADASDFGGMNTAYGWIWRESKDAKNMKDAIRIAKKWMKKLTKESEKNEMGR